MQAVWKEKTQQVDYVNNTAIETEPKQRQLDIDTKGLTKP